MGKEQNPRRVAENEAFAKTKMLRTSPQKLNLVAAMIRGKKVDQALNILNFTQKKGAVIVKKVDAKTRAKVGINALLRSIDE